MELHGSFARTGEGHGTDKAIVAGLMGFRPDDERWIRSHVETLESLFDPRRPGSGGWGRFGRYFYRLARKAARTAR